MVLGFILWIFLGIIGSLISGFMVWYEGEDIKIHDIAQFLYFTLAGPIILVAAIVMCLEQCSFNFDFLDKTMIKGRKK